MDVGEHNLQISRFLYIYTCIIFILIYFRQYIQKMYDYYICGKYIELLNSKCDDLCSKYICSNNSKILNLYI